MNLLSCCISHTLIQGLSEDIAFLSLTFSPYWTRALGTLRRGETKDAVY